MDLIMYGIGVFVAFMLGGALGIMLGRETVIDCGLRGQPFWAYGKKWHAKVVDTSF